MQTNVKKLHKNQIERFCLGDKRIYFVFNDEKKHFKDILTRCNLQGCKRGLVHILDNGDNRKLN